ncbi:VOC family protein [Roseateles cellulosilyticus]|uniref:VOC family protein n=1 Tax=Pelomonas cellulosilytica TaxID=2906762 RepID=A0ABS8XU64_9BURK|nr:VOC family protein [Pelomonas sp. P8]MCE4556249.1 VOC family protein [Pelomonas sp. P8]
MNTIAAPRSSRLRLSYVVIETRRPERWRRHCEQVLGLPPPREEADGSLGWQLDGAWHRLIVKPGKADDLAALGLEAVDEATLDALLAGLRSAGVEVGSAPTGQRINRHVQRLHELKDPEGNGIELCWGLAAAREPFNSDAFPGGFHGGDTGFGHVALVARDLAAMEAFYTGLLGFGVTERLATRVGPLDVRGTFMHCNARHHTVALMALPLRRRLHHLMLQAADWRDVGAAHARARAHRVPMSLALGQHPDPDGTFSFYAASPSGFDIEIGAASGEIDPVHWRETATSVTSRWGHEPQWHLQWQMAKALLTAWLPRRRTA